MAKVSEMTKQAQALIGIKEGSKEHQALVDLYNSNKPLPRGVKMTIKLNWCAMFASILAIICKATNIFPIECSCGKMIEKAKKMGIWIEDESITPKEGYFILYDWQDNGKGDNKGWPDHIGYVEKVANGKITIIEGNYGDKVDRRIIDVNAVKIRGYIAPKYEAEDVPTVYYPKYTGKSIFLDTILKAVGVPAQYRGSWRKRIPLAEANNISNYKGKGAQNSKLKKLAKNGTLKRV